MANAEDTYIFKENIRHPSKTEASSEEERWITARDFAYSTKKSNIHYTTGYEGTVNGITLNTYSYNFNENWVNITDKINEQTIDVTTITPTPPTNNDRIDSELLGEVAITFSVSEEQTEPPTFDSLGKVTLTDNFSSYTVSGTYNTEGEITLTPTDSASTMPDIIPVDITTSTVSPIDYIQDGDTVIVPSFDKNNVLSLNIYDYYNVNDGAVTVGETTVTPIPEKTIDFSYFSGNIFDNEPDNPAHFSLTSILERYFTEENSITINKLDNSNNWTIPGYAILYGNGAILNRYSNISGSGVSYFADYHTIICFDQDGNYVIVFNSSGQITHWFKVNSLQMKNNKIDIAWEAYTPDSELITKNLIPGWSDNITQNLDFDGDNAIFQPATVYSYNTGTVTPFDKLLINTKQTILEDNEITSADTTVKINNTTINYNYPIASTFSDNNFSSNFITKNKYNIGSYTWTYSNDIFQAKRDTTSIMSISLTNSNSNDNYSRAEFSFSDRLTVFNLLDSMIKQESNLPLTDIYFNIQFIQTPIEENEITGNGHITYQATINNPHALVWQQSIKNVAYGGIQNNLWNLIKFNQTSLNSPNIYLQYYSSSDNTPKAIKLQYYLTDNDNIQEYNKISNKTRVWFIENTEDIVLTDGVISEKKIYFIPADKIKVPAQFINLIAEEYTKLTIKSNAKIPITYNWHEYATIVRYYGADNKLLNVGDRYTPVYIKDGQFYPCVGLNDVEISQNAPTTETEIWIDID